ncbi:MAG: glycosyltransferase family 2 protein [Candidatus Edwardsbacteria bacterium]|nr:glycosyltransferase family 2 protein [Candidatus Edwardsbacteria bacterium]MBU1575614.1 glycosyltransferase family 2 protein [Candidatus Edwardsbacteria bacterium]MBU2464039.1 glycosyltransferase family 2 protein [Candidatus Edwardsbacteria bacterium]MBU2593882.1 glycosyltransferase family 2 protein [Candidatus Edwardsbacteria bacterium]
MDNHIKGLVSIVIPTYNCADYVCVAVESCLSQTYQTIEIIVVDDGSTDNTRQRLKAYIDRALIKYLYQENGERSKARNNGIKNARGEFLQFLDVDDLLEKSKIEKQINFLKEDPNYFGVYCAADHFGEVEKRFRKAHKAHTGIITKDIIKGNFILINTMLTRRSGVLFDESLNTLEDWDYWFHVSLNGRRFGYIDEKLCLVRRHQRNTSKNGLAMLQGELAVLNKMETTGVYPAEVKYYRFERMYFLGMKGAGKSLRDAIALDPKKIFTCLLFLTKTWGRKALGYLGATLCLSLP